MSHALRRTGQGTCRKYKKRISGAVLNTLKHIAFILTTAFLFSCQNTQESLDSQEYFTNRNGEKISVYMIMSSSLLHISICLDESSELASKWINGDNHDDISQLETAEKNLIRAGDLINLGCMDDRMNKTDEFNRDIGMLSVLKVQLSEIILKLKKDRDPQQIDKEKLKKCMEQIKYLRNLFSTIFKEYKKKREHEDEYVYYAQMSGKLSDIASRLDGSAQFALKWINDKDYDNMLFLLDHAENDLTKIDNIMDYASKDDRINKNEEYTRNLAILSKLKDQMSEILGNLKNERDPVRIEKEKEKLVKLTEQLKFPKDLFNKIYREHFNKFLD